MKKREINNKLAGQSNEINVEKEVNKSSIKGNDNNMQEIKADIINIHNYNSNIEEVIKKPNENKTQNQNQRFDKQFILDLFEEYYEIAKDNKTKSLFLNPGESIKQSLSFPYLKIDVFTTTELYSGSSSNSTFMYSLHKFISEIESLTFTSNPNDTKNKIALKFVHRGFEIIKHGTVGTGKSKITTNRLDSFNQDELCILKELKTYSTDEIMKLKKGD